MDDLSISEEQYRVSIPKCCSYKTLEEHVNGLGLCWGLVHAIEKSIEMDCSGCDENEETK